MFEGVDEALEVVEVVAVDEGRVEEPVGLEVDG